MLKQTGENEKIPRKITGDTVGLGKQTGI